MANSAVVGTLRAVLSADTAEFASAMGKAADVSDRAAKDITKAGTSFAALEPRMASVTRLVKDFSGSLERRSAEEFALAIDKIGGAAKLSESELRRASGVFSDYISKAKAMGQEVPAHIQKVSDEIGKLSSVSGKSAGIIGDIRGAFQNLGPATLAAAGGFATALISVEALTQGLRAAIQFVKDSVTQYLEAEKAQRKLVAALEAQRTATPATIRAYKDLADEFQRTTVFSDDLIMEMETLLVQVGNVMPNEMRGALEAVTNLASGLGIDLRSATMLVAKSFEDNFTALGRAGVVIDQTRAKAEGMTYVLGQIQAKFGGQAQADLKSFSGQLQQTGNQFDELKETIGGVIVQSTAFQVAFALLRGEILKLESDIKLVVGTMKLMGSIPGPIGQSFKVLIGDLNSTSTSLNEVNSAIANYNRMKWGVNPNLPKEWTNYAQKLEDVRAKLAKLEPAQLAQIRAAQALHAPLDDLAKIYGFTVEELNLLTKETKTNTKEVNAAEKAYKEWADEVTGGKLVKSIGELEARLERLTKEGGLNTKAMKAIAEEADKLGREIGFLPPRLQTLVNQFVGLRAGVVSTSLVLPQLADRFQLTGDEIRALGKDFQDINKKFEDFNKIVNTSKGLQDLFKGGVSGADMVAEQLARAKQRLEDLNRAVDAGAKLFSILSHSSSGAFSEITGSISSGIGAIAQMTSAMKVLGDASATTSQKVAAGFDATGGFITYMALISDISDSINSATQARNKQASIEKHLIDLAKEFSDVIDEQNRGFAFSNELAERLRATQGALMDIAPVSGLSRDGANKISADFRRAAAEALNLMGIIEELGGLTDRNLTQVLAKTGPLFDLVARGGHFGTEAMQVLNDVVKEFAGNAELSGGVWDDAFQAFIKGARESGVELEALNELIDSQIVKAAGSLGQITSATITTQDEFDRLSRIALATFNAMVENGKAPAEAIGMVGGSIDALKAALEKAGLSGNEAFTQLARWHSLVGANQPLLDQVAGLNELTIALANLNALNADSFADLQVQGVAAYKQLTAAGFTEAEARAQIKPLIETLIRLSEERGLALDDETQALIDQFRAEGELRTKQKSETERLIEVNTRLADIFEKLLPRTLKTFADSAANEFGRIGKDSDSLASGIERRFGNLRFSATVDFESGAFTPPSGFGAPVPGAAEGGFIAKTGLIRAHAGEVIGPLDELDAMGQVRIDNRLFIDGREVTTSVVRHLREEARRQGVRPI